MVRQNERKYIKKSHRLYNRVIEWDFSMKNVDFVII